MLFVRNTISRWQQCRSFSYLVLALASIAPLSSAYGLDFNEKGLSYTSPKEKLKLRLGGRLHLDGALFDSDNPNFDNDVKVRRARLSLRANLFENWRINAEFDLVDEEERYESLWLGYRGFSSTEIKLGQFVEPFGLENSTSSNAITFLERALPVTLMPGTNVGLAHFSQRSHGSSALGIFWETYVEDASPFDQREGMGITGRITIVPWEHPRSVLHFGLSGSLRKPDNSHRVRFRARPETHLTSERLVNTGRIRDVNLFFTGTLESAVMLGSFSLQGEYTENHLERKNDREDEQFNGAYLQASWFITGEHKPYSTKRGNFGRIIPRQKWGAWEIAVRKSYLDLNGEAVKGGREENITWGLNWYANRSVRLIFNYVRAQVDETPSKTLEMLLTRLQWST